MAGGKLLPYQGNGRRAQAHPPYRRRLCRLRRLGTCATMGRGNGWWVTRGASALKYRSNERLAGDEGRFGTDATLRSSFAT